MSGELDSIEGADAAEAEFKIKKVRRNETLDVPSPEILQMRKEVLVEKMMKDNQPLKTYQIPSPNILAKVKDFLPQMHQANEKLFSMPKEDLDGIVVDTVHDDKKPYVEMTLAMVSDGEDSDNKSEEYDSDTSFTDTKKTLQTGIKSPNKMVQVFKEDIEPKSQK